MTFFCDDAPCDSRAAIVAPTEREQGNRRGERGPRASVRRCVTWRRRGRHA